MSQINIYSFMLINAEAHIPCSLVDLIFYLAAFGGVHFFPGWVYFDCVNYAAIQCSVLVSMIS